MIRLVPLLQELGVTGQPLKWEVRKREIDTLAFKAFSDKTEDTYLITLRKPDYQDTWDIAFGTDWTKHGIDNPVYYSTTERGEFYRILATVKEILEWLAVDPQAQQYQKYYYGSPSAIQDVSFVGLTNKHGAIYDRMLKSAESKYWKYNPEKSWGKTRVLSRIES